MEGNLNALTTIFTEFYYWVTIVMMFLIHVGFCTYEVGVSRRRNHLKTLMKNAMAIPLVTVTFFFFGWWIYFAFPNGPGITGGLITAHIRRAVESADGARIFPASTPMRPASRRPMPRFGTASTACSGAPSCCSRSRPPRSSRASIIERARSGAFWIIAVLIGSVLWILDAAWGWHPQGWMVKLWGYHDAYASGVVHAIAGGAALAFLIVLGPRIGKFRADGTPRDIPPHNVWLVTIGLFLIYTGFWGFYAACNIPIIGPETIAGQITGDDLDGDEYLSRADHAFGDHLQLPDVAVGRHDGWLYHLQGRSLLDVLMRVVRRHCHLGRQRSLPSDPGHADRRDHSGHLLQAALLCRTPLQDRRCGGRCRGARLWRIPRRGRCGLHAVGTAVLSV